MTRYTISARGQDLITALITASQKRDNNNDQKRCEGNLRFYIAELESRPTVQDVQASDEAQTSFGRSTIPSHQSESGR